MHASMMLSTNATVFTLPTTATVVTPGTARVIGHAAALRFQTAPGGGLYEAVWLRSAGVVLPCVLGCVRELHHVFEFLCLVELQRQRRDCGSACIGRVDRSRFVPEMVHCFALRHARRTRPLRPGVAIRMQAAAFYPQHPATSAKLAGTRVRVPCIDAGEEITFRWQLEKQSFKRRPDPQETFPTRST